MVCFRSDAHRGLLLVVPPSAGAWVGAYPVSSIGAGYASSASDPLAARSSRALFRWHRAQDHGSRPPAV